MNISIIIPVYNAEKFLPQCLESILRQPYHDYEVILVNDGSTDSSETICNQYAQTDPRIRCFHKQNAGPSGARNLGIEHATGDYLLFLDADDELTDGSLAQLSEIICKYRPDAILSPLKYHYLSNDTFVDEVTAVNPDTVRMGKAEALMELAQNRFATSAIKSVIKREVVCRHNIRFPEEYKIGEDICMISQTLCCCDSFCFIPTAYYIYTQNPQSIMHTVSFSRIFQTTKICEKLFELSLGKSAQEQYYLNTQMSMLMVNFLQYYPGFTRQQKKETRNWLSSNKPMLSSIARTHNLTRLLAKYTGAKNAFLLAGSAVYLTNKQ